MTATANDPPSQASGAYAKACASAKATATRGQRQHAGRHER